MGGNKEEDKRHQEISTENNWYQKELPHAELVNAFQRLIQAEEKRVRGARSPAEIVRAHLQTEWRTRPFQDERMNAERSRFFYTLLQAWDALAYDAYRPGSSAEHLASVSLESRFTEANEATVKLSPTHRRVIDALTETAGIPHQKG